METRSEWTGDEDLEQGQDFGPNDPLPDIPDVGDDAVPITPPSPIDFSTKGITTAGAIGMGTFNDDNDETLFERTVDAFEDAHLHSPMLNDDGSSAAPLEDEQKDED